MDKKTSIMQIRLEESVKAELFAICENNGQSPSKVIRLLIKQFIDEHKNK